MVTPDQAIETIRETGGAQPGNVFVVGGPQFLLRQTGELREVGRGVIDDVRIESDLDGGDGHGRDLSSRGSVRHFNNC